MANVIMPPGLMGSSAKEITGQSSMKAAMEALKVSVPGLMSSMGGKGMECIVNCRRWTQGGTLGTFGVRNAGAQPGNGGGWIEGADNIGFGCVLSTFNWSEGTFGFAFAELAPGSPKPPRYFRFVLGGVSQNFVYQDGFIGNNGAVSAAWQARIRSTAPQIAQWLP